MHFSGHLERQPPQWAQRDEMIYIECYLPAIDSSPSRSIMIMLPRRVWIRPMSRRLSSSRLITTRVEPR